MKSKIIKILGQLGISIKLEKPKLHFIKRTKIINIGKYKIEVNSNNPLSFYYDKHPDANSVLSRITQNISQKYNNMGVIDVGANIGDTACVIKNRIDVPIICFEGDDICFNLLNKNMKQFGNVKVYKQFLGEKKEKIKVSLEKGGWNTTILPDSKGSNEIQITTIDDMALEIKNLDNYKLIKIDTEGHDTKIIRGALDYIKNVHPVIFFEYNRDCFSKINEKGIDTLNILKENGYNTTLFYESSGRLFAKTNLNDTELINDLHEAVDGFNSSIYYWDIMTFHTDDEDIANLFLQKERINRLQNSGKKS